MLRPTIILNLKAYREAMDKGIYDILSVVDDIAAGYPRIHFVIAPNVLYLREVAHMSKHSLVFAQHADPVPYGAWTGHIPIRSLRLVGVDGFIVNHSERKVGLEFIKSAVNMAREENLRVCVCGGDLKEIEQVSRIKPTYVAFEPPELIGTGKSVSKMRPEDLKKSVRIIEERSEGRTIPLCGAGISTKEDVALAIKYGALGILVASAFVKAKDRASVLEGFAEAIEENI